MSETNESNLERIGGAIDATWKNAAIALCEEIAELKKRNALKKDKDPIPKDLLLNLDRATRHVHRMLAAERDEGAKPAAASDDPLDGLRLHSESA